MNIFLILDEADLNNSNIIEPVQNEQYSNRFNRESNHLFILKWIVLTELLT